MCPIYLWVIIGACLSLGNIALKFRYYYAVYPGFCITAITIYSGEFDEFVINMEFGQIIGKSIIFFNFL
jgi:hypothetical protein